MKRKTNEEQEEKREEVEVTIAKNDIGGVNLKLTPEDKNEAGLNKGNTRKLAWAMLQLTEED